jgi:peptide-methionine (S)-S-oxide reductase
MALAADGADVREDTKMAGKDTEIATFGGGCFWCVEAIFQRVDGVLSATSGYSGGTVPEPTYRQVCSGKTGHAEVVRIEFDPGKVSYGELLDVFFDTHDPTTLNRQGADVGTQYRSVIFTHSEAQKQTAEAKKKELDGSGKFGKPIVTEISPAAPFYAAEDYHQDYFRANPNAGYCRFVIRPKVEKFEKSRRKR